MKAVFFPNWSNVLTSSDLPPDIVRSHLIAIRWFLSYLRGIRQPATVETARAFIDFAIEQKSPEAWMVDRWKAGIRWFFVNAPVRKPLAKVEFRNSPVEAGRKDAKRANAAGGEPEGSAGGRTEGWRRAKCEMRMSGAEGRSEAAAGSPSVSAVAGSRLGAADGRALQGSGTKVKALSEEALKWIEAARRLARVRHLELSTERAYLQWIGDFFWFHGEVVVENLAEEDIASFLTYLAVERRICADTQRQALNGCVFLLREVMGKELGDFSDFKRAKKNKYLPVVLSQPETRRLLAAFPESCRLMAQLQYGAGLRVSELCRLRIHPVRYYRHGKTLRLCIKVTGRPATLCRLDQRHASQAQAA